MSEPTLRLLLLLHGHAAALATASLFHPAILLWRGTPLSRGGRWATAAATGLTTLAFGLGIFLYDDYRRLVKNELFVASPEAGMLFESKEHLAWVVVTVALGAGTAALVAPPKAAGVRRVAARAFLGAAIACVLTWAMGTWITHVRSF